VITRQPIYPGALIRVRPIGILKMIDGGDVDDKIVAVPISKLDPTYDEIKTIDDLPAIERARIVQFFAVRSFDLGAVTTAIEFNVGSFEAHCLDDPFFCRATRRPPLAPKGQEKAAAPMGGGGLEAEGTVGSALPVDLCTYPDAGDLGAVIFVEARATSPGKVVAAGDLRL
jgi:hypothetical protein